MGIWKRYERLHTKWSAYWKKIILLANDESVSQFFFFFDMYSQNEVQY